MALATVPKYRELSNNTTRGKNPLNIEYNNVNNRESLKHLIKFSALMRSNAILYYEYNMCMYYECVCTFLLVLQLDVLLDHSLKINFFSAAKIPDNCLEAGTQVTEGLTDQIAQILV